MANQISQVNDQKYVTKQYRDPSNLNSRIQLHQQFSVNKYGWHHWVFDQIGLPPSSRILELGCGVGTFWLENLNRIPSGWKIILSDLSPGMMEEARRNLDKQRPFQFSVIDARFIPFGSESFNAVIANHMLYHVPDLPVALSEIRRVLKLGGHFYASTIGNRHLEEIAALLIKFDPGLVSWHDRTGSFTLENGMAQLSQWFAETSVSHYRDGLDVTEVAPLVDYILSGRIDLPAKRQDHFRQFVTREMESQNGVFHITKDSGMFISIRKGEDG